MIYLAGAPPPSGGSSIKGTFSAVKLTRVQTMLPRVVLVRLWTSCVTSPGLNFLIYIRSVITASTSEGYSDEIS